MNDRQHADFTALERQLEQSAANFAYPVTPDIAAKVQKRLQQTSRPKTDYYLLRAAAALLMMSLLALSVPEIRAAILEFLQIGTVRILPDETLLPEVEMDTLASVLEMETEITLSGAERILDYQIMLPETIKAPERIFRYPMDNREGVVLVWLYDDSEEVWFSLHLLDFPVFKIYPYDEAATTVHETPALWLTQPHYLSYFPEGSRGRQRYIGGNVLIWYDGNITYRLEGNLTQETALQIAESLQVVPPPRNQGIGVGVGVKVGRGVEGIGVAPGTLWK